MTAQKVKELIELNNLEQEELIGIENFISEKIIGQLEELPDNGGDCTCGHKEGTYEYVHYGDFMEIVSLCMKCGGMVYDN